MVGTRDKPKLKLKGAETFGMVQFVLYLFRKFKGTFDAKGLRLHRAGEALVHILSIWRKADLRLKPAETQVSTHQCSLLYGKPPRPLRESSSPSLAFYFSKYPQTKLDDAWGSDFSICS
jgi:hypothetical protein